MGVVVAAAEEVTQRVDAERRVMQQEDPGGAAPEERRQPADHRSGQRHAQPERERQSHDHPNHERAIDEPDHRVRQQILGVAVLVRDLHVGEHPADVRMHEPPEGAAPAGAVADVWAVRIAVHVGELMVLR